MVGGVDHCISARMAQFMAVEWAADTFAGTGIAEAVCCRYREWGNHDHRSLAATVGAIGRVRVMCSLA